MPVIPLAQRQLFQTANLEAVRQAHEVGAQVQRERVARKVADDRQAEDSKSIRDVVESEQVKLQEREGRGGTGAQGEQGAPSEEETPEEGQAGSADTKLDFLI